MARSSKFFHFLCKSLLITAFLIFLPFSPSQAPEFLNKTIFTHFWELIYLLLVGIVVSYGLFSRKNVEMEIIIPQPNFDNSLSYASRMFHLSPSFEDGIENSCGFIEKKMVGNWNSPYFNGESVVGYGSSVHEDFEPRLGISENGFQFQIQSGFSEKKVDQARNFQYFNGESMVVVVGNGSSVVDEYGKPISGIVDDKPLGLPIRSLKSRISVSDGFESVNGIRSGKDRNMKFGDLGALNLEEKIEKSVGLPSPIPWRSRSGRMKMRDEEESRSEAPTRSFSSRTSSMSSSSPKKVFPSPVSSISSEVSSSKMEEGMEKKKSISSSSKTTLINGNAPLVPPKSRGFSVGSSFEMDVQRSYEDGMSDSSTRKMKMRGEDDESRFEPLDSSRSFHSMRSLSSRTISMSSSTSPKKSFPSSSSSSSSSEVSSSKMEENLETRKSFGSSSKTTLTNGNAPLIPPNSRRFSVGSSFEMDVQRSFEDDMKDSSTGRMKMRREEEEESRFEPLDSSVSFHSMRSFSSGTISTSSSISPKKSLPSFSSSSSSSSSSSPSSSISSKVSSSKMEENLEKRKSYCGSYSPVSSSSKIPLTNGKAPLIPPNSRQFSVGSSFEKDVRRSFEDQGHVRSVREHKSKSDDQGHVVSSHSDAKPSSPLKASMRAKSVRTFRASSRTSETAMKVGERGNPMDNNDNKIGDKFNEVESVRLTDSKKANVETSSAMLNQEDFFEYQKTEKQEVFENSNLESDKDSESRAKGDFGVSSDEEELASMNSMNYDEEVDKKAGEFIAKFREQIRLQRVDNQSLKGSSGHWDIYL